MTQEFVIRYYELKTVEVEAEDIKEAETIAKAHVRTKSEGSRLLDIYLKEEDKVA